ncbi:MAG: pilus assembly protein [Sphingomonadales bacterium]|nr:pilus assembly protein [Sphingomonadales bacterium]
MMRLKSLQALKSDEDGTSVMEFGLIAMPLSIMLMGVMDVGHSYYVRSVLDGAMQTVARSSALDDGATVSEQAKIDTKLRKQIQQIAPSATVTPVRRYYKTFTDAAAAEPENWTDSIPYNGICDNGEQFIDENNNGVWDEDGGNDGQGGAKDVVIIKVTVTYPRLFPMANLIGLPEKVTLNSNSILANQPYGEQSKYSSATIGSCNDT